VQAAVLAAIFLIAPLWAEFVLVPRYSAQFQEVATLHIEEAQLNDKKILLLGDSTAEGLRRMTSPSIPWVNFSLAGTSVFIWEILAKKGLSERPKIGEVVAMATAMNFGKGISFENPIYLPYLLSTADIFRRWREKEIPARVVISLVFQKFVRAYCSRSELAYHFFSMTEPLGPWAAELLRGKIPASGNPPSSEYEFHYYEILAATTRAHQARLTLILSPASSIARASLSYTRGVEAFYRACHTLELRCISLEETFSDSDFTADGLHVKEELNEKLGRLVEARLAQP